MPFIRRCVEPSAIARRPSDWDKKIPVEYDLTAVTNVTLCGAIQQLASLLVIAEDICASLTGELTTITNNTKKLSERILSLQDKVTNYNPRTVSVPESDLGTFSRRESNFKGQYDVNSSLFTKETRPKDVDELYRNIAPAPVQAIRELDPLRSDGHRSSTYFMCEPVIGRTLHKEKSRKLNLDIETLRPASFVTLRDWCSDDETFSELELRPVSPTATSRPPPEPHPPDLKLPLPEQRTLALSHKFPPQVVPIDVSGRGFIRMQSFRQSLVHYDYAKTRRRRKRLKRRNTIADSRDALAVAPSNTTSNLSAPDRSSPSSRGFSITDRSFDTSSTKTSSDKEVPLQLFGLKVPGTSKKARTSTYRRNEDLVAEEELVVSASPRQEAKQIKKKDLNISFDLSDQYAYNGGERIETHKKSAVKMREGTFREEGTRSSSGNWSGSSSTRTSIESDAHSNTAPTPANQGLGSPGSSFDQESLISESPTGPSISSSHLPTSDELVSFSQTSDDTLSPTQDIGDIPFADDDTSSAFSCDTEGYYTSFHLDSGIRGYEGKLASDSEWEGLGRASTGTTNSSASLKTVIMRNPEKKTPPKPPQRVSSLERKENRESVITVIHLNGSTSSREDISSGGSQNSSTDGQGSSKDADSGRGTASASDCVSRGNTQTDSDADKKDFRLKTAINASGIPSMCSITPPHSDDETVRTNAFQVEKPLAAVESKIYQKSLQKQPSGPSPTPTSMRQPGDGAVAPAAAPSPPKEGVSLTVMSQKRASTGDLGAHFKNMVPDASSTPKQHKEPYTLNKSVVARRAEIQLKVLGDKNSPSDALQQKPAQKTVTPHEQEKLVAYKDLPQMSSASNVPFSAIPDNVKQSMVITPTNSLERKSTKGGAHVTLDPEGKVVYSSDSLPRRKGHTSFEPGPYVKPPPISSSNPQNKVSLANTIQKMPLPPLPASRTETKETSQAKAQPNVGSITQTLSGLSSQMQPRTVSQVQAIRHANMKETRPGSSQEAGDQGVHRSSQNTADLPTGSVSLQFRLQQQLKEQHIEGASKDMSSSSHMMKSDHVRQSSETTPLTTIPEQNSPQNQNLSYESLSYQQKLIQQAYQQQQQLQQLQEEQQKLKEEQNRLDKTKMSKSFEHSKEAVSGDKTDRENSYARQQMQRQQLIYQQQQMAAYQQPYQMQSEAAQRQQHLLQQAQLAAEHDQMQKQALLATYKKDYPGLPQLETSQAATYATHADAALILAQQEMQAAQAAALGQEYNMYRPSQSQSSRYVAGPTSRAPTPIQGLSSTTARPPGSVPNTLRSQPGASYGPSRQAVEMDRRRATPVPQVMSGAQQYDQYNLTNSDIYGRIGMTRQVYVGGTLPVGFGRNQRAYSSLPLNTRQAVPEVVQRQRQQQGNKTLTRRASVVGTETQERQGDNKNDKKDKGSKKEKDKKKKETKEAKSEKPAKKKWFWTLPLRRKKKGKEEEGAEDDDGGFKAASQQKAPRKVPNTENTSFVRYPSPDTGSSDMNSSYSSDVSGEHGYRSSPSSEVYYYTQKSQANHLLASTTQRAVTGAIMSGNIPLGMTRDVLQGGLGTIPRSHSSTAVSPMEAQRSSALPMMTMAGDNGEITDLTRSRRYMSREEMYSAMRHPQYYKSNGSPSEAPQTTSSSTNRSSSPAVFSLNLPSYAMKPQVKEGYSIPPMEQMAAVHHSLLSKSTSTASDKNSSHDPNGEGKQKLSVQDLEPPTGYGEHSQASCSPDGQEDIFTASPSVSSNSNTSKPFAKQTTLMDFKKMILEKSMKSAGGKERVSAVEMLRASRPSIYGYSPPPAPVVLKQQESPATPRGEGIIMPPNSRNTARALLFQSRFGSGGRYRTHRTEIISTTIVEDKAQEEIEYSEEEYESSEEESPESSPDRHSVVSLRLPVSMIEEDKNGPQKNSDMMRNHSTPNKLIQKSVQSPDVSIILPEVNKKKSEDSFDSSL